MQQRDKEMKSMKMEFKRPGGQNFPAVTEQASKVKGNLKEYERRDNIKMYNSR